MTRPVLPPSREIPPWVAGYVGLPWVNRGRSRAGVDCWGLVRMVYAERLGVCLDDVEYQSANDGEAVTAAIRVALGPGGAGWDRVAPDELRPYDVALYRHKGRPWHVGVVAGNGWVLHSPCEGRESVVDRMGSASMVRRLCGVYRLARTPVRVSGRERPFGARVDAAVPAGGTIVEVLVAAGLEPVPLLRVYIGRVEVPFARWGNVRPKPGRCVTVAAEPLGGGSEGGKSALRIIATIALIAGAAYLGAVPAVASLGTVGSAFVVGAATIGGTLLINALAPPPKPKIDGASSPSPTIAGAGNTIRPYEPWPDVLGFFRLVPPYAAVPFTEIAGDDQYLRLLLDCGYGPKELSEIRIGETPIEDFDGVEVELRAGHLTDDPITLYPNTVFEDALQIHLEQSSGWVSRTTAINADEISVDVTFPAGLAHITREGEREEYSVSVDVEYSPAGLNQWTMVNGDGGIGGIGSPVDARQLDLLFRTPEVIRGGVILHSGGVSAGVAWGLGFPEGKPGYLPASRFSWTAEGWFRDPGAPEGGGFYRFGVDGSDACDVQVDGQMVASWYGGHEPAGGLAAAPDFAAHAGAPIRLSRGWHRIRVRMESRSNTGALAVGWLRPFHSWEAMPTSAFRLQASSDTTTGLLATWYDTSVYLSSIGTTASRTDALRRSLAWAVPRGRYDVRLRRTTIDSDDTRTIDESYWTALRTITNEPPIAEPGRALIAMRIKATDQLNGVIDNLSVMVRSVVPDWDPAEGVWIERATNNPASLYRYLLQGRINARALSDARIDIEELQAWHEECTAQGWAFNAVLDFSGTIFERLNDVAAAGRASFGMREGLYSVVRDRPQTVPVQVITPRNSYGFRGRKIFAGDVHALRVQFLNENVGYQRDERVVLNDGYQIGGLDAFGNPAPTLPPATKYETIDLFGTTDPALIWRHGRYHLAVAKLRPEIIEVGMDVESLAAIRGDLVLFSHYAWGETRSIAGRVTALELDTGGVNLTGVFVDELVTMDAGEEYGVRIRKADGSVFHAALTTMVGVGHLLRFANPVPETAPRPEVGDLAVFGLLGVETREMIVQRIDPDSDLAARITLVDHSPAVHLADQGAIPDWDSGITGPPVYEDGPETPVIERIQSDDWVMVRQADGSFAPRMVITLRRPSSQRPMPTDAEVGIRERPPGGVGPALPYWYRRFPLVNSQVTLDQVEVGVTYDVRLRVITRIGQASAFVHEVHTVVGNVLPPPDVLSFGVEQLADGTRRYSWDLGPIPPDIDGVLIRYSGVTQTPDWDSMTALHTGVMDGASPQELNLPEAGQWTFGIKMIDTAGNQSENALFVDAALTSSVRSDLIRSEDARALNWPGVLTDCVRIADRFGPVLEAIDDTTWDGLAAIGVTSWDLWPRWNMQPRSPIVYEHTMDIGAIVATTVSIGFGWSGQVLAEIFHSEDGFGYEGPLTPELAIVRAVRARYIRVRLTVTADAGTGAPVPRITDLTIEARGVAVEHFSDNLATAGLGEGFRLGVGDFRVPLPAGRFAVISHVNLTFNGSGAGYSYEMIDRLTSPGPRVRIYGPDDLPADAVVDVWVRGFAGEVGELESVLPPIFASAEVSALLGAV